MKSLQLVLNNIASWVQRNIFQVSAAKWKMRKIKLHYSVAWLNFSKSGQKVLPRLYWPEFWQTSRMPPILFRCHIRTKRTPAHLKIEIFTTKVEKIPFRNFMKINFSSFFSQFCYACIVTDWVCNKSDG